jgi:autoinducer 2-degrading protein
MTRIAIIGEFETRAEAYQEFENLIRSHAASCLEIEPGCLRFELLSPIDEKGNRIQNKLVVNELFENHEAVEIHTNTDRMKRVYAQFDRLLVSRRLFLSEVQD